MAGTGEVKRGRIGAVTCLDLLDDCWPLARIARLVAPGADAGAMAWLYGDDGEVVVRTTAMPTGTFTFTPSGATAAIPLSFADIAEIMFAVRSR